LVPSKFLYVFRLDYLIVKPENVKEPKLVFEQIRDGDVSDLLDAESFSHNHYPTKEIIQSVHLHKALSIRIHHESQL